MLLTLFLVQKWLGSSFPEDVWAWWLLMHWLQLQFTPCEALPSVWIGFAWQYSQACGHHCCLCTFSYRSNSFQSTLHLICFDTALLQQPPPPPFSNDPLCGGCQWSSSGPLPSQQCSPLLCFQRTREFSGGARGWPEGGQGRPWPQLIKTAIFIHFFLTRNAFIKTQNQCIFLHPHQAGYFSDGHCSFASAPGASQMSEEKVHQPNELQ